jgi:hypothetical protein
VKNFTIFSSNFLKYLKAKELDLTLKPTPDNEFECNIIDGLFKCHIFEVSQDIKRLLILTSTPKINEMLKLPFPVVFIDVSFKKEELEAFGIDIGFDDINGIIVKDGHMYLKKDKQQLSDIGTTLRISISALERGEAWIFETYAEEKNIYDEYKDLDLKYTQEEGLNKKARRFIHNFVLNFLNFVNNPEIRYVTVEADEKRNLKRIESEKIPIPDRSIIKLDGVLKRYTDELRKRPVWHYNYRFWVRGHFRTLRNERYGDNVGKRIWIPPFIKGKGLLIENEYLIKKTNGDIDEK